jgi:flagellar biosynthesis anti-sigma factor FlgM
MKISTTSQQPVISHQAKENKTASAQSGAKGPKAAGKTAPKGDSVKFSGALDTELKNRQTEQAKRVQDIKTRVNSGKYDVSSREVAEKILSRNSGT